MNADAKFDALFRRQASVALDHAGLHFDRAAHGVDHAPELDDRAVAGALDNAPVMHRDDGVDEIAAERPQARKDTILVRACEPAISDDVRRPGSPRAFGSRSLRPRQAEDWHKKLSTQAWATPRGGKGQHGWDCPCRTAAGANLRLLPKTAFSRLPPVQGAELVGQLRVDLTRSLFRRGMSAVCAFETFERRLKSTNCVEKLRLIVAPVADSFVPGAGDSTDDGRAAGDAGGAVLRLQP